MAPTPPGPPETPVLPASVPVAADAPAVPTPAMGVADTQTPGPLPAPPFVMPPGTPPVPAGAPAGAPSPVPAVDSAPGFVSVPAPVSAATAAVAADAPLPPAAAGAAVSPEQQAVNAPARPEQELSALIRSVFRRPDGLPRHFNAPAMTRDLADTLRVIDARSSELEPGIREGVRALVREIASDLQFTHRLHNEFTPVLQIPLALPGDRQATASLYVWNDAERQGRRIDPKNATLFLSLFTAHMGRVEALCKVIGPSVEADFKAPGDDGASALRGGGKALADLLEAHGYTLRRLTATLKDQPSDMIDADQARIANRGLYSFDRRV